MNGKEKWFVLPTEMELIPENGYDYEFHHNIFSEIREKHATDELAALLTQALEDMVASGKISQEKVLDLILNENNWKY